jgi:hypothetical protein
MTVRMRRESGTLRRLADAAVWQNKHLWAYFQMRRDLMMERSDGKDPKIVRVWHGTRRTDPKAIYEDAQDGFMMQFSDSGMWGRGIYFAVNAEYSHDYAHRLTLPPGQKSFLLAKLIVGDVTDIPPDGSLVKPPDKPSGGRYDTVSGDTNGSKVYIVYENGRAYPEYLVTYTTV